jgi:glycosyltransferase involved in cell wall biosynthesis
MEKPLISVVLCTYNGAKYLAAQLDSILRQTYKPLELIVSDDASTDDTRQVLQRYESNPVISIYYNARNIGLAKNFAYASGKAKGEYIAYSDQDDIWIENKIERLYDAIREKLLIYSDSEMIDKNGNGLGKKLSDIRHMYTGEDSRGYIFSSVVWGHGMLIKKELLELSQPLPANVHHDVWLAFKAITHGGIVYLNEVLTKYRQHPGSSSITLPDERHKRKDAERYRDYKKQLGWMQLMHDHERDAYKPFYSRLIHLYSKKEKGKYVWPLVFFMMRHRRKLFMFPKKSYLSNLIEIFKHGRGVDKLTSV